MQRNAPLIPVLAVAAVVFSACDELPAAPEETPPNALASYAATLWDALSTSPALLAASG